jgi:ketosteroid isomerase-like protein
LARSHCFKWFLLLVVLSSLSTPVVSQADVKADEAAIRHLEAEWCDATVTNNVDELTRVLADDFLGTEVDGHPYTKEDAIREAKSGPSQFTLCQNSDDLKIRFYGSVSIVQGSEGFEKRDGSRGKWVFIDVFVRRKGVWQVVASEDILVPAAK